MVYMKEFSQNSDILLLYIILFTILNQSKKLKLHNTSNELTLKSKTGLMCYI